MIVAHRDCGLSQNLEGKLNMKTLVSLLVGGMLLFGAATVGTQAASAQDRDRNNAQNNRRDNDRNKDNNNNRRHRRHHRRHHRHRRNKLSY
jgi:Ni/Co efflux regulator RcnB